MRNPPPLWWQPLCDILGLSAAHCRLLWRALSASRDPRVCGLVYRCGVQAVYLQRGRPVDLVQDGEVLLRFLAHTWQPKTMCLTLEALHEEGLLSRQDCTAMQERFLAAIDKHGRWRTSRVSTSHQG